MRNHPSCSGFTMMEILVAMVLMALVGATALSSFSSTTKIVQSDNNTALNVARSYLEQLYEYVNQSTYSAPNAPLALTGATLPSSNTQVLDGVTYTTTYSVNATGPADGFVPGVARDLDGDGKEDYRKVTMTVSW